MILRHTHGLFHTLAGQAQCAHLTIRMGVVIQMPTGLRKIGTYPYSVNLTPIQVSSFPKVTNTTLVP